MGTTYSATIPVQCLKEHACVGCQGKFSYLFTRNIKGSGGTQEAAMANAQRIAIQETNSGVDFHPCPMCGIVQPDMIATIKSSRFWLGLAVSCATLLLATVLGLSQIARINVSAYIAFAGVGFASISYFLGSFFNPNRNLDRNILASQQKIESKQLMIVEESNASNIVDRFGGMRFKNYIGLICCIVSLVAIISPMLLAQANDWHLNDSIYPAVAGAGDRPTIYLLSKVRSLEGKWRGSASAELRNAADFGLRNDIVPATSQVSKWSGKLKDKQKTRTVWAQVVLPQELADANGKVGRFSISVTARFPVPAVGGFRDEVSKHNRETEIRFSKPHSGKIYYSAWLFGQIAAALLMLSAGVLHLSSVTWLRKQANPITPITMGEIDNND